MTSLRYARHCGLRRAGLSVADWALWPVRISVLPGLGCIGTIVLAITLGAPIVGHPLKLFGDFFVEL
jgi:hypothetical protein